MKKQNKYLKNIDRIEFPVTYACTGNCAHCSVGDSSLHPSGTLAPDEAASVVFDVCSQNDVSSVMTFGGEPLLFPEITAAIHSAASQCAVKKRQLITNGFFSREKSRISEVVALLCDSGVNDLLLSVDAFHQETIPLEPVIFFAREASRCMPVRLSPSWVVGRGYSNAYNERTREIVSIFEKLGIPERYGNDIFLSGRAEKNLACYYPECHADLNEKCGSQPYTMPLDSVSEISVEPNGDVSFCSFCVGNIRRTPILDILEGYDPYASPATAALLSGGVSALLEYAHSLGRPELDSIVPENHRTACSICRAIASLL